MSKSLAQIVAELPAEERARMLSGMDPEGLLWDWSFWGRPEQHAPDGDWNIWIALAGRGWGKAIDVDTPIATPSGWVRMGDLVDGDTVFDENGSPCRIVQAHQPYIAEKMYRFTFSDGSTLDTDAPHQWVTWTHADRKSFNRSDSLRQKVINDTTHGYPEDWVNWTRHNRWGNSTGVGPKIRTTQEIADTLTYGKRGDLSHSIPTARALQMPEQPLPFDPYVFGLWLGDGSSSAGEICAHADDIPSLSEYLDSAGLKHLAVRPSKGMARLVTVVGLYAAIRGLGVLGSKNVPDTYLWASPSQRAQLLAGLLDSDGYIDKDSGQIEFVNTNKNIADAVVFLARSLGQKPVLSEGVATLYGKDCGPKYRVMWRPTVNPFYLSRKRQRFQPLGRQALKNFHRMIVKCEQVEPTLVRCLTVDSPNSMYLAGEALIPTHNTRTGAEWLRDQARDISKTGPKRIAIVARTAADARDVVVEGQSGIMSISPPSELPLYEPSKRRLTWPNGTIATTFSADEPNLLRGPQFHASLADEAAAWRQMPDDSGLTAWQNLRIATRLGAVPKIMITTTPKRVAMLRELLKESEEHPNRVRVTRGSTMDNAGNLSSAYLDTMLGVYGGTSLAAQELYGEMLDSVDGALWTEDIIDNYRQGAYPPQMPLRVIGVDPSVAESPKDECGIVVVGSTGERDLYKRQSWVLEDTSILGSPTVWAQAVVAAAKKWGCPVVAEVNQGGALVKNAIHTIDPTIKVLEVHSKYGKALRAEPITLAYEQGRVHHVGVFPQLESQMMSWIPGEGKSPDRVDALVHALTALLIKPPAGFLGGGLSAKSPAGRRFTLPGIGQQGAGGSKFRVR